MRVCEVLRYAGGAFKCPHFRGGKGWKLEGLAGGGVAPECGFMVGLRKIMKKQKSRIFIGGVIVIAACAAGYQFFGNKKSPDAGIIYAPVEEGPLVININEAGSIKPREQIIIKSELEGRAAILFLVPEGTRVKKGDILVELDTASLEERRVSQDIVVQNNESAMINAKENLAIVENQSLSNVELAELKLRFAKEDLEKYREGEYPKKLNETNGSVTLAEEELQRAQDKYEWSKRLFDENYISETELLSDELSWKRAELSLKTARGNLELLEKYTYKRDIAQLESDVWQNEMSLERTRSRANSDNVQAEVNLRARELEYNRQQEWLRKLEEQIVKAKIVAPMDGLVIYATSAQNRWGNQEPLAEGQEARERQELIYLPTADTFIAEIDMHESNLKKVYPGLPVRVKVDAVPGVVFKGTVDKISPLPDAQRMWANPDLKVYKTQINIEGGGDVLKSGMNCQSEIIIDQYDKALYLPVQCVARVDKLPTVWLKGAAGPVPTTVEIGLDNNRFVRIISGLKAGDEVMLTPPLSASVASELTETLDDVAIPTREESLRKTAEAEAALSLSSTNNVDSVEGERRRRRREGEGGGPRTNFTFTALSTRATAAANAANANGNAAAPAASNAVASAAAPTPPSATDASAPATATSAPQ